MSDDTTHLDVLLDRYLSDEASFDELVDYAARRLRALARTMLARYPHVRRWEETDDVMQTALIRLHRSLKEVRPDSKRAFFGLAATQIRRTLIDLARHYYGTYGLGKNYNSVADHKSAAGNAIDQVANHRAQPDDLEKWTAFHEAIGQLPEEEREVMSLVWYSGMLQKQVASTLDVSERTVIRRMNRARLTLNKLLQNQSGVD